MNLPPSLKPYESEHTVLGAAISGHEWATKLIHKLKPEHFCEEVHGRMWACIQEVTAAGSSVDASLLFERLKGDPALVDLGGIQFLYELADKTATWTSEAHADIVVDRALRRELVAIAEAAKVAVGVDVDRTAFDHLTDLEHGVDALMHAASPTDKNLVDARSAAIAAVDRLNREAIDGRPRGLLTGLRCFDMRMRGLRPGWLVIIAGRPSMGKSGLARSAALATATRYPERLVVFFALEMDRDELSDRTLSELSWLRWDRPVAYKDLDGTKQPLEVRSALRQLADEVPVNFILDDTPELSIEYVRRRLYALKARGALGAAFIDYLQIMKRPDARGRNEALVIQDMTQALKQLARELGICIVLLSQLNRGVEQRDDKRPLLSDLRDSGAIEQDANAVFACYRPFYYLERSEPQKDGSSKSFDEHARWEQECELVRRRMDVLALKVRAGAVGTDRQAYYAECDHVEDVRDG